LKPVIRLLNKDVVVADKAVEARDPVIERTRGDVVLLGGPIETIAIALARRRRDRFDQAATAAAAANGAVDEQILQITHLLYRPGMRVKEVVGDPDERGGAAAEPGSQTADRTRGRNQALPSVLVYLGR
jgi:hypothetical protein